MDSLLNNFYFTNGTITMVTVIILLSPLSISLLNAMTGGFDAGDVFLLEYILFFLTDIFIIAMLFTIFIVFYATLNLAISQEKVKIISLGIVIFIDMTVYIPKFIRHIVSKF